MPDVITSQEQAAISHYLKITPYSRIKRKPGSIYDPDSPNFVREPGGWRQNKGTAARKAESSRRKAISDGLRSGKSMEKVAGELGVSVRHLRRIMKDLAMSVPSVYRPKPPVQKRKPVTENDEEMVARVKECIAKRMTVRDTQEALGLSHRQLDRLRERYSVKFPVRGAEKTFDMEAFKRLLAAGASIDELKKSTGLKTSRVHYWKKRVKEGTA